MLPGRQVCQQRPCEIVALSGGAERRLPVVGTVPPCDGAETVDGVQRRQFLLARPLDAGVTHRRGRVLAGCAAARRHGDGDRGLDGEHIVVPVGAALLAAEVEYPYLVAHPAHVRAHPQKGVAVEITRRGDEADDARTGGGVVLEDLPQRPAPEIDIEIVKVLQPDAVARSAHRGQKVVEDGAGAVPPPHPRTGAVAIVGPCGFVAVVGRVAEAYDDGDRALDAQRLAALFGDGLKEERRLRRVGVGAFQRVGEKDAGAVGGQGSAPVGESAADAQLAHRIGAGKELEPVKVLRQHRRLSRHRPRALIGLDPTQSVFDDAQQIGPGAGGRVEGDDIGVGEAHRFAHPSGEQRVDQAHLGADHLNRRVVDPGVLAEFGVVIRQKVLVEVEPGVALSGERDRRDGRDHAQQQVERGGERRTGAGVGKDLQGARQQAVLRGQRRLCAFEGKGVRPLAAPQQQGEGHGLGVGIGELRIRGVGEQELPPVPCQHGQRRGAVAQRIGDIVAQHPAQRSQHPGKLLEIEFAPAVQRQHRLPQKEIAQQPRKSPRVLRRNGLRAVGGHIAGEADETDALAAAIQRPFAAVAVKDVGEAGETPELLAVAPAEPPRVRTDPRSLELDMAGKRAVAQNRVVGTTETVGQPRLARAHDRPPPQGRRLRHQILERRAQPVLRRTRRKTRPLRRNRSRKTPQRPPEPDTPVHRRTTAPIRRKRT